MNIRQFKIYGLTLTALMTILLALSIQAGKVIEVVTIILVWMGLSHFLRSRVDEIMYDEMTYRIGEKAARRTLQVIIIPLIVIGLALIASKPILNGYVQAGYTLLYIALALAVLYSLFYMHYHRKPVK